MILPLALLLLGQPGSPPTTYLIPGGYHGLITIVHDEGCGLRSEGASGQRMIRIPDSGIAIVQERARDGEERINCQLVNGSGAVTGQVPELVLHPEGPLTVAGAKPDERTVYAALVGTWVEGAGHEKFTYSMVCIGTEKEIGKKLSEGPAVPWRLTEVTKAVKDCRSH